MLAHSHIHSHFFAVQSKTPRFSFTSAISISFLQGSSKLRFIPADVSNRALDFSISRSEHCRVRRDRKRSLVFSEKMEGLESSHSCVGFDEEELDRFVLVGNKVADAAGEIIRQYFRKSFEILDKDDLSPVTIADRAAEESMIAIILENFPSHAIYGEENGWRCKEKSADHVWVLDPIDGTKSFITGKPLFGTLIALLHKGIPIIGIIDQPVLRERWVGMTGRKTTLNGQEVSTRPCSKLSNAYLSLVQRARNEAAVFCFKWGYEMPMDVLPKWYTTSPHLFSGDAEEAFARVRSKVKVPLYGCDCYAYALLASGHVDLVIESGLKPYDFLSLVPVIEGAGGLITDWKGHELYWEVTSDSHATSFNVVAAGDAQIHKQSLHLLQWQ